MRRRRVLAFFTGAALSPILAGAQEQDRVRRIGVLTTFSEQDPLAQRWIGAFRKELDQAGWREGRDVEFDYGWAADDAGRLHSFAKKLVKERPAVIFAVTTPAVAALLKETRTIPIVFAVVSDPLGSGFVKQLSRPGGNVTGFTDINIEPSLGGKWVELVKETSPAIRRVAMLYNPPTAPFAAYFLQPFEAAGLELAVQTSAVPVNSTADIEAALATLASEPGGAFVVLPDAFAINNRNLIVALAARHRLPAVYPYRFFANIGGLLSYGIVAEDLFRRAAAYVGRILKGAKPADLPVQAPTNFELVVNLKTAAALGLTIPQTILAAANEVIE
jgi:putative tryptophan/tyrosine transport system substrate-binding protein